MARPRRVRALLPAALSMVLVAGAALGVSRPPDPLDGVKTSIRLKNFAAAATELQKLAAGGNPDAQYLLAVFYLNGVSGPRDPATAKTWLEKAANKGSARAAFSLATLLQDSNPPDPQGASRWLARGGGRGGRGPRRGAPHPPRRAGGGTRSEWHDAPDDRRARRPAGRRGCRARGAPERQRDGQERQYRADACRHERLARRGR